MIYPLPNPLEEMEPELRVWLQEAPYGTRWGDYRAGKYCPNGGEWIYVLWHHHAKLGEYTSFRALARAAAAHAGAPRAA